MTKEILLRFLLSSILLLVFASSASASCDPYWAEQSGSDWYVYKNGVKIFDDSVDNVFDLKCICDHLYYLVKDGSNHLLYRDTDKLVWETSNAVLDNRGVGPNLYTLLDEDSNMEAFVSGPTGYSTRIFWESADSLLEVIAAGDNVYYAIDRGTSIMAFLGTPTGGREIFWESAELLDVKCDGSNRVFSLLQDGSDYEIYNQNGNSIYDDDTYPSSWSGYVSCTGTPAGSGCPPVYTYSWQTGSWGSCSNNCGTGSETRSVWCERSDGTTVDDSYCSGTKPSTSRSCTDYSGCTYLWQTGSWSECSEPCGGGTQIRSVWCERSDGTTVADGFCTLPKPDASQTCNTQPCFVFIDIGLRIYDGTSVVSIAADPDLTNHPLRIHKNGQTYGVVLVDPSDPDASSIKIQTSSGIKALRKI